MTQQTGISERTTRRLLQFMLVCQVILLWEALKALVLVVVSWSQGLDASSHAWNASINGFIGLASVYGARLMKRSSSAMSPQT
jgi:hypothetical protein